MIQLEGFGAAPLEPVKSSRKRVFFHVLPGLGALAKTEVAQRAAQVKKVFILP